MGPATVAFLKDVYARAKADATAGYEVHVEHNGGVVVLEHTPEATDAEFQNRIIIRDHTMKPNPDPNKAAHGAAPASSRSAEPKGPGTTVRNQPSQVAWEAH
jgi:hypothetical protein